ncbi:hypothetical protein ACFL1G_06825 [Planctomycetota bacterium]
MKKLFFTMMIFGMFAGCDPQEGPAIKVGVQSEKGQPLDVAIQTDKVLSVKLNIEEGKSMPVKLDTPMEVKINSEQALPVKLEVQDGQAIPVQLNIPNDEGLPVQIKLPQKASIFGAIAALAGLCIVFTSCVVALIAVLSAKKAQNIAKSAYLSVEDIKTAQRQHQRQLYGFDQ